MDTKSRYNKIIEVIAEDFSNLDVYLSETLTSNHNALYPTLKNYIFSSSKRIRSALVFLVARALGQNICSTQLNIACAVELIHNATLIHDDVIDKSDKRRGQKSLNAQFDNTLAIIAGDYLLSLALENILKANSCKVLDAFTKSLKLVCQGEIEQYFAKFELPTIEQYIKKSKLKTAKLFEAALTSVVTFENDPVIESEIKEFAKNFGIAFQIRDDLNNLLGTDKSKPCLDDLKNGIYSAAVIFAAEQDPNLLKKSADEIIQIVQNSSAPTKTRDLSAKYINFAIANLKCLEDNQYKAALTDLCELLKEFKTTDDEPLSPH